MLCPVDLSGSLKAIVEHPICILKPVMIVEYHCYQDLPVPFGGSGQSPS